MIKNKFLLICILIIIFINFSFSISYGIDVPEKDINLVIKNLTRGSEVYMLLPEDLVRYNMQKFIDNNIENNKYFFSINTNFIFLKNDGNIKYNINISKT